MSRLTRSEKTKLDEAKYFLRFLPRNQREKIMESIMNAVRKKVRLMKIEWLRQDKRITKVALCNKAGCMCSRHYARLLKGEYLVKDESLKALEEAIEQL